MKKFIHIDLDAFYASVAQLDHPKLREKPVVIGGSPQGRGVVMTASYEARKFGIRSAMPCSQAYRLCPHVIFHPADFDRYRQISQKIHGLFREVTDLVEPLSLDEAYLDVTENFLNLKSAQEVAVFLKNEILKRTGLTASAGVAPLKFVAKIASDFKKPDGLTIVPPHRVIEFISPMSIKKLWSVGPVTEKKLNSLGIYKVHQLATADPLQVTQTIGKHGRFLIDLANGKDRRQVQISRKAKSRGIERTFGEDVDDPYLLTQTLRKQALRLSKTLEKKQLTAKTITLKLRYSDFTTITRSQTLQQATRCQEVIYDVAYKKLMHETQAQTRPIRLIGISTSGFPQESKEKEQLGFSI